MVDAMANQEVAVMESSITDPGGHTEVGDYKVSIFNTGEVSAAETLHLREFNEGPTVCMSARAVMNMRNCWRWAAAKCSA